MKLKIALIGWNGMKNVGDDAMTDVIINQIAELKNVESVFVLSSADWTALSFLVGYQDRLKFKFPIFFKTLTNLPLIGGFYYRYLLSVYLILFYNLIIIGGGTLYHSKGLNRFFLNLIKFRRLFNKSLEIVSIGVSVGPFKDDESLLLMPKILNRIDFISVRDQRSYQLCKQLSPQSKCYFAPDIALGMPIIRCIDLERKNEIGIVLRQGHVTKEIKERVLKIIEMVLLKYPTMTIVFHCFCELESALENDYIAYQDIEPDFPTWVKSNIKVNRYNSDPVTFYESLASSHINLCVRLHGSILSYAVGAPFLMFSYHQKCKDFFTDMEIDNKYLISDQSSEIEILNLIDEAVSDTRVRKLPAVSSSLEHFSILKKYK